MNFRTQKKGRALILNVTSLIDVMFLLLIFFMVTSTFKNQPAINLVLPRSATASETVDTPVPYSVAVSHGNRFQVLGRKVGLVAAGSFKSQSSITDEYKSYDPTSEYFDATDYLTEINLGALLNLNVELAEDQQLSFKNLLGRNTEESYLSAYKLGNQLSWRHVLEWEEKQQLTSSVAGTHGLPVGGLELRWRTFYNENNAKEPDLRYLEYHMETDPISMLTNRRHWLYADEYRRGLDTSLDWTLGDVDRPAHVTVGISLSDRSRSLQNNTYTMGRDDIAGGLVFLPPEEIFAPENFKEGLFTLRYQDQFEGSYDGTSAMNAYYGMVDLPFRVGQEEFRLAGGARLENNQIAVDAFDKFTETYLQAGSRATNLLPSANLTYSYDERTNVRLAYYQSVNYPEMREIAPVKSSDFKNDWEVEGNPDLEVATIDNYDLRLEYFPSFGEVFAVSFFYKDLTDAIETSLNSQPNYLDLLSWFNGDGKNYGFELEVRSRLDFVSRALYDFTLAGNYTRVWSEVDYQTLENPEDDDESARFRDATRQLQGQAPWVVNLSLKWESLGLGTSATLLYNRIGRRLVTVAEFPEFNVYEEPRNLLDAAVTQSLGSSVTLKLTAKNILGEARERVFDVDRGVGDRDPVILPYGTRSDRLTAKAAIAVKF